MPRVAPARALASRGVVSAVNMLLRAHNVKTRAHDGLETAVGRL